ncbi:hypothetical protein WICPIJ_005801 [Wickerhamomyces pijperi]|uniref:UDENN domain-containing protein n=1 Tax=Wickerhamomyces pijperi TaxID=599730 RepID=A0A9P8TLM0_WICPI|nr:hypothetical protein WICPIJ_005801 [Wickerhamomyces pijperi]
MDSEIENNPWTESEPKIATRDVARLPDTTPQTKNSYTATSAPASASASTSTSKVSYIRGISSDIYLGLAIVNFHHTHGPEIEYIKWNEKHVPHTRDIVETWPFLPFQALPDGAHLYEESFSVFTLDDTRSLGTDENLGTVFAISCTRQIKSSDLIEKEDDVTRSSVQKSIVVLLKEPIYGVIHDKLSIVTKSYFEQRSFKDKSIIDILHTSLTEYYREGLAYVDESDFTTGLAPQTIIKTFQRGALVILKAILLEKRVVFYSKNSTKLCNFQLCMISLIPNLINNLHDCSSPDLDTHSRSLKLSTSFQTSNRNTVLEFAGMPLQIFGLGGIFNPYCPLQQFDQLKNCKFYTIGSSNAMVVNMKSSISDVFIDIDSQSVEIVSDGLQNALSLTSLDRKWMDQLLDSVSRYEDTTDFQGSDDYLRMQFEDYLLGLVSTVKFQSFISQSNGIPQDYRDFDSNQIKHFNEEFVKHWKSTGNYEIFSKYTDDHLFDVFEPRHILSNSSKTTFSSKLQELYKKTTTIKSSITSPKFKAQETKDSKINVSSASSPSSVKLDSKDESSAGEARNYNKIWPWNDWKKKDSKNT